MRRVELVWWLLAAAFFLLTEALALWAYAILPGRCTLAGLLVVQVCWLVQALPWARR